ncbi:MAG TPA: hypothetical protein VFD27_06570 [Chthoniobacteraceae bacterium]|nr:hypothetical protein [Chthoniobacteraceae bacterium]
MKLAVVITVIANAVARLTRMEMHLLTFMAAGSYLFYKYRANSPAWDRSESAW